MDRRQFLAVTGATSAGMAGCLGDDGGGDPPPDSDPPPCEGGTPSPPATIETTGDQFTVDAQGRTVLLHGVNVVYKREPYYPPPEEFDESDVEKIRDWGFNFVRLGAIWAGVEPERGVFDQEYLGTIRDLVQLFADHDIYVLLDYHQNLYSHVLGGDGAPEWAVFTEGELEDYEYDDVEHWAVNYADAAVSNALGNFFRNHEGIRDEYAAAWRETAAVLGDEPNVVGYSLMNEPTPALDLSNFETDALPAMFNDVIAEIRTVDTETPIWIEPSAHRFNIGLQTNLTGVEDPEETLVFSFHNYAGDNRQVIQNAVEAVDRLQLPGVQTEFSTGNSETVATMVEALDDELMGWAYWPYDESSEGWQSPAEYPPDFIGLDEGGGRKHLDVLVRPYPQAVAGVPTRLEVDLVTREFTLAYDTSYATANSDSDGGPAPNADTTVVFVPERHFENPEVTVDGATIDCYRDEYLRVHEHTGDSVTISISEPAVYHIQAAHSGKLLTPGADGDTDTSSLVQKSWEGPVTHRWRARSLDDDTYRLDHAATGTSLAVPAGQRGNGDPVVLQSWDGAERQRWRIEMAPSGDYRIENVASGRVLDVRDQATDDGAVVQQWEDAGGENQRWRLRDG